MEEEFEPILYQELDRHASALYFHPSGNGLCSAFLNDYGLTYAAGAPMEDTTVVTHLMAARDSDTLPQHQDHRRPLRWRNANAAGPPRS